MKLIIDANIVFSAILNPKSKIGDILINSKGKYQFIAPEFLKFEIRAHYPKIAKISKLALQNIVELEFQICREINFISEEQINSKAWEYAYPIGQQIDEKDTIYIAYSKHFKCRIWTGDKKLINGLRKQGFTNVISTNELTA